MRINKIIKEWKKEAKSTRVVQYKYDDILKKELGDSFKTVHFIETDYYWA